MSIYLFKNAFIQSKTIFPSIHIGPFETIAEASEFQSDNEVFDSFVFDSELGVSYPIELSMTSNEYLAHIAQMSSATSITDDVETAEAMFPTIDANAETLEE